MSQNSPMPTYQKITLIVQGSLAIVGVIASFLFGSVLSEVREISSNVARAVEAVERIANIDPAKIAKTGETMSKAAETIGTGASGAAVKIGEGSASAISAVKDAMKDKSKDSPSEGENSKGAEPTAKDKALNALKAAKDSFSTENP